MNALPSVLGAHTIEPEMREAALNALNEIEQRHQVTVLFACESGSRAWGFASPDSDYDVRFVYVSRLPAYLAIEPQRDVIELPISKDLDVNGWDLRKALGLLRESNPTLLEWLRSPIIYREQTDAMKSFRALAQTGFSPVRAYHHYLSMAKKNFREHLQKDEVRYKKYLYVLRPLLAARWIRDGRGMPPMPFAELAQATLHDGALIQEINALLRVKMSAGEASTSPRWKAIHHFIEQELEAASLQPAPMESARVEASALNTFLHDAALRFQASAAAT